MLAGKQGWANRHQGIRIWRTTAIIVLVLAAVCAGFFAVAGASEDPAGDKFRDERLITQPQAG